MQNNCDASRMGEVLPQGTAAEAQEQLRPPVPVAKEHPHQLSTRAATRSNATRQITSESMDCAFACRQSHRNYAIHPNSLR